jgi:hypothetical protein
MDGGSIAAKRYLRHSVHVHDRCRHEISVLPAHTNSLKRLGKQSARDVESIFSTHVFDAEPDLASKKAAGVTIDDFVVLIGKLTEAEKGRTAAKLRSNLRAAYSLAIKSKTDPSAPQTMRTFGINANPLASVGALAQFSKARSRVLNVTDRCGYRPSPA